MRRFPDDCRPKPARRLVVPAMAMGLVVLAGGADRPSSNFERATAVAAGHAVRLADRAAEWYLTTPPADRVTWGGLAACGILGLFVLAGRSLRLRHARVLPSRFVDRFLDRVRDGQLERGKGTDLCDLNPSPASRIALAALRRWGRPAADLERAVSLAKQVEVDRLRRNVGTLRRIAALAPLVGLLGTLLAAGRALSMLGEAAAPTAWGPALAGTLAPLTAGVALAILALVAFDGLMSRVESLSGALDRFGAEAVDGIVSLAAAEAARASRSSPTRTTAHGPHFGSGGPAGRPSQPIRVEIPEAMRDF